MDLRLFRRQLFFIRLLILSLIPALLPADPVGLITASRGQATIIHEKNSAKASMGTRVYVGDVVTTDPHSTLELTFIDKSTLSLAGGAELLIENFTFAKGETPQSSLRVKKGAFSFLAGEIAKIAPERYRIHTDTATIGIRGSGGVGVAGDGLLIATIPGHVLDVWTDAGQHYVLNEPLRGLRVTAHGVGYTVPVLVPFHLLSTKALDPVSPYPLFHGPISPSPYQAPQRNLVGFAILPRTRMEIVETTQGDDLSIPQRELSRYLDAEEATARPLLERQAGELRKSESELQAQDLPPRQD